MAEDYGKDILQSMMEMVFNVDQRFVGAKALTFALTTFVHYLEHSDKTRALIKPYLLELMISMKVVRMIA